MDGFDKRHAAVILLYYVLAAVLLVCVPHPVVAFVMGGTALAYYMTSVGIKGGMRRLAWGSLIAIVCLIVNPLFNHRGVTLLFMVGRTRITWEAFCYGADMAVILLASLQIFSCFSRSMTAEKVMTLTAKRFPSFSLLFSMILRLVPKTAKEFRDITSLHGNRPAVWSAMVGIVLEDSMKRGMSMKARGYGGNTRSSFYQRKLDREDVVLCIVIFLLAGTALLKWYTGGGEVRFFPGLKISSLPLSLWLLVFVYGSLPILIKGKEEIAWYVSRQRITGSAIRDRKSAR